VDNGGVKGGVAAPGNLQGGDAAKWRGLEEAVGAAGGGDCGSEKHWEDFFFILTLFYQEMNPVKKNSK
jgi:hypothetical protein